MFIKKFMIGLPLASNAEKWREFLSTYRNYIESVYFSVPLGKRFHSRQYIANQFLQEGMVDHFWNLIKITQELSINLELVLNTYGLSTSDIESAYQLLVDNGVVVTTVTCLDCYYEVVNKLFIGKQINYSYNNFFNNIEELGSHVYSGIIIGRYNIRNTSLFKELREKGLNVILLLNNGCSHRCGWCHNIEHCQVAFEATKDNSNEEYLYAEQSIMPFEIHEGYLDVSDVYCFKINNRNGDLEYLQECLDSYIHNDNELHNNPNRYALWARLRWFEQYYHQFDLMNIIKTKKNLYLSSPKMYKQYKTDKMRQYNVTINLCDEYSVLSYDSEKLLEDINHELQTHFHGYKFRIEGVRVGAETCCRLFNFIKCEKLISFMQQLKSSGLDISIVFPVVDEANYALCKDFLDKCIKSNCFSKVVVNDFGMLSVAKEYQCQVALGRMFDKRLRDPRVDSRLFLNGQAEELGLLSEAYLKLIKREEVIALEIECLELGIAGTFPSNLNRVYVHYPYRYITSGRICEFAGIGEDNSNKFKIGKCKVQCMKYVASTASPPVRTSLYKHCNALIEEIKLTDNIINSFEDSRLAIIYTPRYMRRYE